MEENSKGEKRLGSQLKELNEEGGTAFVAAEMACGAPVSDSQANEIEAENANI